MCTKDICHWVSIGLSSLVPLFQNESNCKTFLMKMSSACMQFHFHANQSHFHKNDFALDSLWNRGTRELGNGLLISSIDSPLTSWLTVGWKLTTFRLMDMSQLRLGCLLTDRRSSTVDVNWVPIKMLITVINILTMKTDWVAEVGEKKIAVDFHTVMIV